MIVLNGFQILSSPGILILADLEEGTMFENHDMVFYKTHQDTVGYLRVHHIYAFLNGTNFGLDFLFFPGPTSNPGNTVPGSKVNFSFKSLWKVSNGHPLS